MHYLSVLTEEGYPGAQALLAELLWRGRYVKKDERRALALITMAVENAPEHERIWIEDIYQNIFCGTLAGHAQAGRRHRRRVAQDVRAARARRPTAWGSAARAAAAAHVRQRRGGRHPPRQRRRRGDAAGSVATPPAARPEVDAGQRAGFGLRDVGGDVIANRQSRIERS